MRKPRRTVSAVADFLCSAAAVWQVLTREESYKNWFGFPKQDELVFVDPGFSVGGKLSFKGLETMIITSILPERELVFSDGAYQFSFHIEHISEGVSVAFTMDSFAEGRYEETDARLFCTETLRALKRTASAVVSLPVIGVQAEDVYGATSPFEFARRMFAGYRRPVTASNAGLTDGVSSAIDNTEASVTIVRRALMFAFLLTLFYFTSIGVSLSFQRSDIVPSSGLSLFESVNVNKYDSTLIRVGDQKQNLERRLSCQGDRVFRYDGTPVYHYASLGKNDDNEPDEQIFVVYDAYGKARSIAYVDVIQSSRDLYREPSNRKLKEGIQYFELDDKNIRLSPSMNLYEVEEIVGVEVSAYVVVKSGESIITTLYFGKFVYDDIFTTNYMSQIVVVLNEAAGTTSVTYHNPAESESSLPLNELSKNLRRQYAGVDEYLFDRFAFERMFLLLDLTPEQSDILLSAKGNQIKLNEAPVEEEDDDIGEEQQEETEPELPETIFESYVYRLRNPSEEGKTYFRYSYTVDYEDGLSTAARFRNERLSVFAGDTISHLNRRSFNIGMSYYDVVALAGILPSAAECSDDRFTLHYGREEAVEDEKQVYSLSLTFDTSRRRLLKFEFYEIPETEEIPITEIVG
ncbi:MAG: hypothetical protein FWE66_02465 [Oscillospiraceae bacterium]|nr:hypothetical protein [Oscillospiraceae bacterium]